ncbi:MAG TPA: NAD+ synthase [Candidatus Gastranaerophilales bacterium]|nr:NAD+ synthase [Candidatus Gastranaerophilales bacterium]
MKIAIAQINTKVGDLKGNADKIIKYINQAKEKKADLVVFPELSICGYPPRDLLDFECFVDDNLIYLDKIKKHTENIAVICGFINKNPSDIGKKLFNAAAVIKNGEITAKYYKRLLPFYDVFDETRYFEPGKEPLIVEIKGKNFFITICEDLWNDKDFWKRQIYHINPADEIQKHNVDVIINLSASPYLLNKEKERFSIFKNIAVANKLPVIYVNQSGGNDDLIFDGTSFVIDGIGEIKALCGDFQEDFIVYDLENNAGEVHRISETEEESVFNALCAGVKDYCDKTGFKKVLLGLSGGIDSAVTAVIASYALGKENVLGITLPGIYSSEGSVSDSEKLAANLGIEFLEIPITGIFDSYINFLQNGKKLLDLTEENLQARIRANILMMYSNRYGHLLLTTGNKSELSVGYCTLYGDMCGGLAVLSDIPKIMVYRLANYINRDQEIIPLDTITKPPSAELSPDQKDQDTLPPYEVLDDVLKEFVEQNKSINEISEKYPEELVKELIKKINICEYKRRQAALGLKVTTKAFGAGRRFPIAQGYDFYINY